MISIKIDNVEGVKQKLLQLMRRFGGRPKEEVVVGFAQNYAIYVHEIQANHPVGQWKYLETAYRNNKENVRTIIADSLRQKMTLIQAQLRAGLKVQRDAQELTPVDTGALKASAFTCPAADVAKAVEAAFSRSEVLRATKGGK